jgi:hypothetical protein
VGLFLSMSDYFFIRPNKGHIVRDPETMEPLTPGGEWKEQTYFWRNKLADGAIYVVKPAEKGKRRKR